MQVSLLALGGGTQATWTEQCKQRLLRAQCIVGAARLLENLPDGCTQRRVAATKPQKILEALQGAECDEAAVVYSGDTGFYSGCRNLVPLLQAQDIPYVVCPGISSVQLMAAALHRPWQDWLLVSAHGVQCDAVAAVMQGKPAFFLTGGSLGVPELCSQLTDAGLGDLPVTVGENLSYPDQRIVEGTAAQMQRENFAPLCVLLAEAAPQPPRRMPGWPDAWFIRGKVPMTKRQVRAAILAALNPGPEEVFWDVGAGTGSVSVELAACIAGWDRICSGVRRTGAGIDPAEPGKVPYLECAADIRPCAPGAGRSAGAGCGFCGGQQRQNGRNSTPCAEEKSRRSVMCELHCPGNAGNSPGILP